MNKKVLLTAVIFTAVIVAALLTAVYIPEGYTAVTPDGKSLYSEGLHPFERYSFESIPLVKLSEQCERLIEVVNLNDMDKLDIHIRICWEIKPDINTVKEITAVREPMFIFYEPLISNTRKVFSGFNISDIDPYDLNASRSILEMTQRDLNGRGIIVTEVSVSLPSSEELLKKVMAKKQDELREQAKADLEKAKAEYEKALQDKENRMNDSFAYWVGDVPEGDADFFIKSVTEAFYARFVKENTTGLIVPTVSFSKGPSRNGLSGFVGIYQR